MGTAVGFFGAYVAAAAIFYLRLTATASSNGMIPKLEKRSRWHRARHLTKAVVRRLRF